MSLLSNLFVGWAEPEPVIWACIATDQNLLFSGRHGIAKSKMMQFFADVVCDSKERVAIKYSMDKENVLSMVGMPNPDKLKEGVFECVPHQRSVLKADAIFLDEITRARGDAQNLLLDILEEGSVMGTKLTNLKLKIASANPDTYMGARTLDPALKDRFNAVVEAPDVFNTTLNTDQYRQIIQVNMDNDNKNYDDTVAKARKLIADIRDNYKSFLTETDEQGEYIYVKPIQEFCAQFVATLNQSIREARVTATNNASSTPQDDRYISHRHSCVQFPKLILTIAAYYASVDTKMSSASIFKKAASVAIKYSFINKIDGLDTAKVSSIFKSFEKLLEIAQNSKDKMIQALSIGSLESRIQQLQLYGKKVNTLKAADRTILLGEMNKMCESNKEKIRLWDIIKTYELSKTICIELEASIFQNEINSLINE